MDQEKTKRILLEIIKWLKVILAVAMFLLGLLNEGVKVNPNSDPLEIEEAADSLAMSAYGFILTAISGCPLMFGMGAMIHKAFVCGF